MHKTPSGELIRVGQLAVRFLVEATDSNESVTAFECFVPANANMPAPHCHDGFEETVYGLEGTTTYTIGGEDVQIGPGDCVCIPRGTVHAFRNDGDNDAKFLAVASPGVFGPSYFLDIAEVLARSPRDRRTFRRWVRSCAVTDSHQLHLRGAEPLPLAGGVPREPAALNAIEAPLSLIHPRATTQTNDTKKIWT